LLKLETLSEKLVDYLPNLLAAFVILVAGWLFIKIIIRFVDHFLARSSLDITIHSYIKSAIKIVLMIIWILTIASSLGLPIASILAVLGAAGVAISLALQSSLSNVAGGFLLLINKRFSVGDFIEVSGISGTVSEISLSHTVLNTIDNKKVYIPNSEVVNNLVTNYSAEKIRRLDIVFSISYNDNIEKAKNIIKEVILANALSLKEPAPFVAVTAHNENSIDIISRTWVETDNYLNLNYALLEEVKKAFDREGINIPFPQMDLHIVSTPSEISKNTTRE